MSVLSTTDLLASVRALAPKVAVFDCDGTLWKPDSGSGFMRWSEETELFTPKMKTRMVERYRGYRNGEVDEITICGEMVSIYEGLPEIEVRESAARFFEEKIEPFIFPEMLDLVIELREAGVELWAVSSTADFVVEEGVKRFGIPPERVLATCVHVRDGVVTGDLRDIPSDHKKAEALVRVNRPQPDAVFGNSVHDVAMLEIAKKAFPINPSEALAKLSNERNWPVYYPAAVQQN